MSGLARVLVTDGDKAMSCSIPGCANGGKLSRAMCSTHYARWRRHGDPLASDHRKDRPRGEVECSVDDCSEIGRRRGLCGAHYRRNLRHGDPGGGRQTVSNDGPCAAVECDRPARTRGYCPRHYARLLATGDPLGSKARSVRPVKRYRTASAPDHPLASVDGTVLVHRKVLFDAIGVGPHRCNWCGTLVEWATGAEAIRSLVVDHLDHDKQNNAPSNLVPSCNPCNGHRVVGSVWAPWRPGMPIGRERRHALCRREHVLTPENVYVNPGSGRRQCRQCIRLRSQARSLSAQR